MFEGNLDAGSRCTKVSGNGIAVNSELKMAAAVRAKQKLTQRSQGISLLLCLDSKNIVVKNTLKQEIYHFYFI